MKIYDTPEIEIFYYEDERISALESAVYTPNAAGAANSRGGATVTTGIETLFGNKK